MLLDHADFALQEQAEDNLMVVFFFLSMVKWLIPWPIKSLELHYTMIQFLIIKIIIVVTHRTVCKY